MTIIFKKLIIFLSIIIFLINSTLAININPAVIQIAYNPGESYTITFFVSGTSGEIKMEAYGNLVENVSISEEEFILNGSANPVYVTFTIPKLTPGKHSLRVKATEVPKKMYGRPSVMGATAAVVGRIDSFVPYPNKYATIKFEYDQKVEVGETTYFKVTLENQGSETIEKATGQVKIFSWEDEELASVPLTELFNLPVQSKSEMLAEWSIQDVKPGKYKVKAIVDYDGNKIESIEYYIWIGEITLEIINLTPTEVQANQISEVSVLVKSIWNEDITFYSDLLIKDINSKILEKSTSPTMKIAPWETEPINLFLDTNGLTIGEYDGEVILYYNGKESKETFKIKVVDNEMNIVENQEPLSSSGLSLTTFIIIALILIIILLTTYFIYNKKLKKNEEI